MAFHIALKHAHYSFPDLKTLLARATPARSGDQLAGLASAHAQERVAAQLCLADVPLQRFLDEPLVAPEIDEVSLVVDGGQILPEG